MMTVFLKTGKKLLIEDFKLFSKKGQEAKNYNGTYWRDFHTLVEVFHVDGVMKTGLSISVTDIEKIENEPE